MDILPDTWLCFSPRLLLAGALAASGLFAIILFAVLARKRRKTALLEKLAFHDAVTGSPSFNRLAVDLPDLVANGGEGCALLAFGLVNFRNISISRGMEYGNDVLRHVTAKLQKRLDSGEMLVHIWGNSFVAFLRDAALSRVNEILEPVTDRQGEQINLLGGLYPIGDASEDIYSMYEKAVLAESIVRSDARRRVGVYDPELGQRLVRNDKLNRKIEKALRKREFLPYFQPKVDIHTGMLVGAEALVRWKKEDGALVAPAAFVPLCESTGRIVEIDMLVYERVLAFLRDQLDRMASKLSRSSGNAGCVTYGLVPVSINFSRWHIDDPNFIYKLVARLDDYGVPPELVEIELTESLFYDDPCRMASIVESLGEKGLRVAMDDFGTGFSSLSMLKDAHIDVLKIDQAFLRPTMPIQRRNIIFAAIVEMAARLHIDIVVEGVETAEHVALMQQCGCYVAQGYYFHRPMPPEKFAELYVRNGTQWFEENGDAAAGCAQSD